MICGSSGSHCSVVSGHLEEKRLLEALVFSRTKDKIRCGSYMLEKRMMRVTEVFLAVFLWPFAEISVFLSAERRGDYYGER